MLEKNVHIHITTSTAAGRDLLETLLKTTLKHDLISGSFFPLDLVSSLKPWIKAKPKSVILMETELWPNLIRLCKRIRFLLVLSMGASRLSLLNGSKA